MPPAQATSPNRHHREGVTVSDVSSFTLGFVLGGASAFALLILWVIWAYTRATKKEES